ncbi:unnamed protein product, partial [marine sediment metagenome]
MSTATTDRDALYARALEKQWFYPLTLPDGRQLTST